MQFVHVLMQVVLAPGGRVLPVEHLAFGVHKGSMAIDWCFPNLV